MRLLIDTNVLSELRRSSPARRVVEFVSSQPLNDLHLSVVTLAELRYGIGALEEGDHRSQLDRWLTKTVRPMFRGRVIGIDEDIVLRWRSLVESGRKVGKTHSQPDLLIAATALEHNLQLVTRNTRDFTDLGLSLINPWD